jgi:hypothetical protein
MPVSIDPRIEVVAVIKNAVAQLQIRGAAAAAPELVEERGRKARIGRGLWRSQSLRDGVIHVGTCCERVTCPRR